MTRHQNHIINRIGTRPRPEPQSWLKCNLGALGLTTFTSLWFPLIPLVTTDIKTAASEKRTSLMSHPVTSCLNKLTPPGSRSHAKWCLDNLPSHIAVYDKDPESLELSSIRKQDAAKTSRFQKRLFLLYPHPTARTVTSASKSQLPQLRKMRTKIAGTDPDNFPPS